MKLVRAAHLAKTLGISRHTVKRWCQVDPHVAIKIGRYWWIRLERLAARPGMDIVLAMMLPHQRWVKAVLLSEWTGIPRKTIANWCRDRQGFARRLGRIWYVDVDNLSSFAGSEDEAEKIRERVAAIRTQPPSDKRRVSGAKPRPKNNDE